MHARSIAALLATLLLHGLLSSAGAQEPDQKKNSTQDQNGPATPGALDSRMFELLVVGPDDRPVPKARFEIRIGPKPKGWIFYRGEVSDKPGRYGTFATTDEEGGAAFEIPATGVESFSINVTTPGFGPFWAQWQPRENTAVIPDRYTIHLDAAVSVGGITVDDQGRPIAGVEVHPSLEFKKREGDLSQLAIGTRIKSDENGRWVFHSAPASLEALSVSLDHPEYMGAERLSLPLQAYTVPSGAEPSRPMIVPRGEIVTGRITSSDGKPLPGARVRARFLNLEREAVADENGVYVLKGCRPGSSLLTATAKGWGPQAIEVKIRSGMEPLDFQLPAGRTIRVRAVDGQGRPIPKFRVFIRKWKVEDYGYGLGLELAHADQDGVWEWNDAPADAIVADICPPKMMQLYSQTLTARDEDYVFTFTEAMAPATVFGSVTDRLTGKPIPSFRVVPGELLGDHILWNRPKTFDGKDGRFYFSSNFPRGGYQFRIEASGYLTSDSEYIQARGGPSQIQVQLMPGEGVSSTVLLPSGEPATGATVVIGVAQTQIYFRNGEFSETSSYCDRQTTDAAGRFSFPSQVGPFEIIVVHPSGSAWINSEPNRPLKPITLRPWAGLRGVVKSQGEPVRQLPLRLSHHIEARGEGRPNVNLQYSATTSDDGSFEWSRLFPGQGTLQRSIKHHVTPRGYSEHGSHNQPVALREGRSRTSRWGPVDMSSGERFGSPLR